MAESVRAGTNSVWWRERVPDGGVSSCGLLRHYGVCKIVGFFAVAAHLRSREGPITALLGGLYITTLYRFSNVIK